MRFVLTGSGFLLNFNADCPAAQNNALQHLQFELKFSYIVVMKSVSKKKNIDTISRRGHEVTKSFFSY
jgi:hypothetical protein